ncbi:MAG TPA: DegT/DnrJ/EryC1/StrS family aminotransferase [Gemmatimonadaceae bacterium]
MIGRRQLPVSSTISLLSLLRAVAPALGGGAPERAALDAELRRAFGASGIALTDSGTSALVIALRATTPAGGIVALPAYACVDVGAAALFASARVMLYDINPNTLSPDLESVERVLGNGARTVVVAHLYGYPADVPGVSALASAHGAAVIEDAAQGAWGSLSGTRLGAFGPLSVLSFGRGKGMTGSGGGSLLGIGARGREALALAGSLPGAPAGARALATAAAQWALGRPALYALPSAIPALHLGETIYHPAHEPCAITGVSASLVRAALARAEADLAVRRRNAEELVGAAAKVKSVRCITPISGGVPGYLRLPIRVDAARSMSVALGIVRGYPDTLAELTELRSSLVGNEKIPGSLELQRTLVTIPTHAQLTAGDIEKISAWLVD